jgi:hypothetical protein
VEEAAVELPALAPASPCAGRGAPVLRLAPGRGASPGMLAVRGLVVVVAETGSGGGAMGELGREGETAEGVARTGTDGGGEADGWNCGGCRSARTPQERITTKAFAHFAASDAATDGGGAIAFCSAYQRCRCRSTICWRWS